MYTQYLRNIHDYISWYPSSFISQETIWILGVSYEISQTSMVTQNESADVEADLTSRFMQDFESRLWFTYRRDFEPIGEGGLTTDAGWGCMLRSGQMLLAQALMTQHLGRAWRRDAAKLDPEYLRILRFFHDSSPSSSSPLSIHALLSAGTIHGLTPGAWLGPSALCHTLKTLATRDATAGDWSLGLHVHVAAGDREGGGGAPVLCPGEVLSGGPDTWQPVLILVPLMLGSDRLNPRYLPSLRATFTFPQSLGVLGGKPGGATYLVGIQGSQVLYLDPHEVQAVVDLWPKDGVPDTSSYHCKTIRKMALESVDPSLALAFFCRTSEDLNDFFSKAQKLSDSASGAPLFTVGNSNETQHGSRAAAMKGTSSATGKLSSNGATSGTAEDDWQLL